MWIVKTYYITLPQNHNLKKKKYYSHMQLISKVLRNQESAAASDRSNNMASKKVDKKDKDSSREPKHIRFSDSDSS